MELTTRPRSGFNWPDTDEKKKSNEFDWPEVDPTTPEPELQTFTYQDRLNAAKEGRTIGANTEPESVDGLRLEFITGFEKREGDALMKGETMRNLSRDEVLNYIEAKEAQGFDYGRMMGGIAPAMGTVLDELTRGVFVRGSLDFASGASAPLIEGFHKNLGKESPMNRELRQALGIIQRGNPDRTSMRLAMRMPQGRGVTGGTLEERAQEYLTKAHVTNGQLMASLLGKKVKDLGYDKLPQWMIGGQRGEQEITEEMFGPIAESVGRAAWSEFVDSVPESDRKHLKKLGYDSIFDGFDRPKTISTTAQAKVAASTLANFPARILASMGEGVAQAGHGTAMIGHMAVANWDGGLAKLDQSVNNYLANEALRYRKANNLPIPKKGDELLTGLPEDVVAGWKDKIKPLIEKRRDRIVESWMTKHQYMAEMERARQGKEPVISQALRDAGNDGAAEAFSDLVNKDLALGLSYIGDAPATVAVGAVRQGLTKGTVRSAAGRGVASKAAEGTGKVLKGVDEKIIAPFSRAPQAASNYVEDAIGVGLPKRVVGAADFVMTPAAAASSIVGGAGDVLEAVGRATSSGQTLQGNAAKIFNDPNAAPWLRNVAGKLQFADPFFEYGYNVMSGTVKGGFAGGAITLATGDEDMIAGGIGSGLGAGFAFAVPASMGGVQRQIKAKNTIDEWLGLKEQEAATAEKAGLTEQAQVLKDNVYILKNLPLETQLRAAELELIVKGFGGHAGKGDIPVEYIFAEKEDFAGYYDRDSQKVIVNLAKAEINDGASLAHEVMHALEHVDNDAMRTTLANINSVMFGDGGIYSMDAQRDRGNQYLARFWEGVDAQRNELLKMDPKDPDYAAAYEQYQLAKASVNKKLGDMDLAPDPREVTAEGFDANAKFQSIVRSEIRAEDFSSMYRSQDPGALLEGPSLVANVKRQVILAKSYSNLGKLRYALENIFKVQFGEDGAPSPLFKNEKGEWATSNPMVNQLLKDYVTLRKNIGEQAEILAKAENDDVMVPTSEEMASNPLLMEMFKGDDHVVKDPTTGEPKLTPDGRPVILSSREVRKLQRERIKAIDEALQLVDSSGGLQRQADERTGKVRWGGGEEGWTAPIMNDAQVEAIMALPDNVIPANKKEQIKIFHEAMKAGKTVEVFYRGITGATAKRAGWRQDSPFGVEITLDGNVNFRTINLNRLQDNIDRWTNKRNRKTKLDLWDENVSDFLADFATYRENHRNGRPGHFGLMEGLSAYDEAIALARKERLNELVGVSGSEKARSVSIEGPRRRGAESTRSWQGILKIQPADSDFTLSYPKLRQNFMPAGADKGGAKFMPAGKGEKANLKHQISTRFPTAKARTDDPIASVLNIGLDTIKGSKDQLKNHASILRKYPGVKIKSRSPEAAVEEFIEYGVNNLLWLHDLVPEGTRDRSSQWYDGANKKAVSMAKQYGTTVQGNAGALAALSPQKDWFMNVSLGERVVDIATNQKDTKFSKDLESWLLEWGGNDPKIKALAKSLKGKSFDQLNDYGKAAFIRAYDEVNNSKSYDIVSPEGKVVGIATTKKGDPAKVAWGSMSEINKALRATLDPSAENISNLLGNAHKVRNFYNNILLPNADGSSVTIDTHAVAAALLRPLAGNDLEVGHNFGTASPVKNSSITGAQGTYGIYADMYRRAAAERGILPRQMQSITWEAVRGLYEAKWKTKSNKKLIDNIWKNHETKGVSLDETRQRILDESGGITPPEWERSGGAAVKGTRASGNEGKLSSSKLRQGRTGNDSGTRGRTSRDTSSKIAYMPAGKGGDIFYSNSSKALESPKVRNSATGAAMLNDIIRQDPAARQEMKWIDLDRWLMDKKGKVTKEEVRDFIDANQIAVVEKVRGGEDPPELRAAEEAVEDARQAMYDADDRGTFQEARDAEMAFEEAVSNLEFVSKDFDPQFDKSDLSLPGAVKGSYRELELMLPKRKGEQFKDSHFETDENVFAHVRFNERVDADGKRMLFIEELQGDWAASGRERGFNEPYINGDIVGGREESVPAAPFVSKRKGNRFVEDDKWRALAMKRMIRWGADNGFDRVGWITGRDTADRYNLSKFIDRVEYQRLPGEDRTMVSAWDKAGNKIIPDRMVASKDMKRTVGRDLAEQIAADKSGSGEFEGLELAVGGEGHKQFYDIDLPNYTGKYVKKWGGKVGMVDVSLRAAEDVEALKGIPERTTKAHYVDITPEMKADVQQGQAMFMPAGSDAAYMRAAEKGDIKGAQLLVDQAAKAASEVGPLTDAKGMPKKYWHYSRSSEDFNEFNLPAWFSRNREYGDQFFRRGFARGTDAKEKAKPFYLFLGIEQDEGMPFPRFRFLDLQRDAGVRDSNMNPWKGETWIKKIPELKGLLKEEELYTFNNFNNPNNGVIQQKGVLGALSKRNDIIKVKEGGYDVMIVLNKNVIKSADPITRDDAGNIIPLSERFQPSSDDIRYMPAGEGKAPRRMGSATSRPARTRIPMGAVAKQLRMERDLKELKRN